LNGCRPDPKALNGHSTRRAVTGEMRGAAATTSIPDTARVLVDKGTDSRP
jgi:hypothetical protein